jgi:hypothetical protein
MNLNPLLKAICPHSKNQQAKKDKELNKQNNKRQKNLTGKKKPSKNPNIININKK